MSALSWIPVNNAAEAEALESTYPTLTELSEDNHARRRHDTKVTTRGERFSKFSAR